MTEPIRTLVVGVATLAHDDPAQPHAGEDPVLAPAVELARGLGATLHVVHVYEKPAPVLAAYAQSMPYAGGGLCARYGHDLLDRLRQQVTRFGYERIRCHAAEGSAGRTLVEVAAREKAQVVVVGATRRGRFWRNLLGTTADRVIRGSPVPVLVLHQPFGAPVRRVLLTTDLSHESARLHDRGADTAAALFGGALELRTLMVVWFDVLLPPPLSEEGLREAAAGELREFVAQRPRADRIQPRVRFGEVPREVVREAEEWPADLLVLGTHGRSGFSRLALGSTAAATLRGAGCNVLVVPRAAVAVPKVAVERAFAMT
ncbi:universal stress protein [Longimicrobium sp.]|uniref:universal stress protein n=1 Tax=Longimicrobium sp. TaxID=2029185 RepID=UPI002C14043E|nr:universal stress protein [Longimicrobium sp.]HSU16446.1 universal stress protein [Longimicrobium sp.]